MELFNDIADALMRDELSGKFTYALLELLQPYLTASTPLMEARALAKPVEPVAGFNVAEVIRRDFAHVLGRQQGPKFPRDKEAQTSLGAQLTEALDNYLKTLKSLTTEEQLQQVIGLLRTAAFAPAQHQAKNGDGKSPS